MGERGGKTGASILQPGALAKFGSKRKGKKTAARAAPSDRPLLKKRPREEENAAQD